MSLVTLLAIDRGQGGSNSKAAQPDSV